MSGDDFEWDDANVDHIARHEIDPAEVEEAFTDRNRRLLPARRDPTERRRALIGMTEDGRLLFIVFTNRFGRIRIVTAREASAVNRRWYGRSRR